METAFALKKAGSGVDLVHINELKKRKGFLNRYHILAIPGGFTYGDDIASGKILANEIKHTLQEDIYEFISGGKLIIGICNGFQVLVKIGILPGTGGGENFDIESTLSLNDSGKFIDKWVDLTKNSGEKDICVWTKGLPEIISVPIAHAEGKFVPKNKKVLRSLFKNNQIVFRYKENPNGSVEDIAAVCDPTGRILGMMPHPERHISYLQNPGWRRGLKPGMGVGIEIFKNGVKFARENLVK
jgi:phosphoribosylformylglycinamidine synthase